MMTKMLRSSFSCLLLATSTICRFFMVSGVSYRPGLQPRTYMKGESIPLRVDSMTSIRTQIPVDYYHLPFCKPSSGPKVQAQNLGEFLEGSRIQTSPYQVNTTTEVYCQKLCQVNLTEREYERMKWHIERAYHHNWWLDHLPAASIQTWPNKTEHYANGFQIGYFCAQSTYCIFNHFNLVIDYQKVGDGYRVIEFAVQPISVQHAFEGDYHWDGIDTLGYAKPLTTCSTTKHMSFGDVKYPQKLLPNQPILFTYDVTWRDSDKPWSRRWEVYLTHDNWVPVQLHWNSIMNSFMVVLFLTSMVVAIWRRSGKPPSITPAQSLTLGAAVRELWTSPSRYTSVSTTDDDNLGQPTTAATTTQRPPTDRDMALQEQSRKEEINWRSLHGDVFRPPATRPAFFCALVGTGAQLAVTCFIVAFMAALGRVSQAIPGSIPNAFLVVFNLSGCVAGYVSYRIFSSFGPSPAQLQKCVGMVAVIIPGSFFASFCFLNICLFFRGSTASLPFSDVFIVMTGWLFGLIPLVIFGAYLASLQEVIEYPTHTNPVPRAIPTPTSCWKRPLALLPFAAMLPYGAMYVEVFSSMTSLWFRQYYFVFTVAFVVYTISLWTAGATAIVLVAVQLRLENHRWWWFSLFCGGSAAFGVAIYALSFMSSLELDPSFVTYLIYFLYMFWVCVGIFLIFGSVGFLVVLYFLIKLYERIDPELLEATDSNGNEDSGYIMLESFSSPTNATTTTEPLTRLNESETIEFSQDKETTTTIEEPLVASEKNGV